jgi:tRNA threonylcarbamoyladenosine biosynthesis protein TsaE
MALVVALRGDLGAGKTQFVQGLAKGLVIKETINSPTFVILKKYPFLKPIAGFKTFYHIDCYRLNSAKDLAALGIKEIFKNPENIVAIEWPEIINDFLPKSNLGITFKVVGKNKRQILIYGCE